MDLKKEVFIVLIFKKIISSDSQSSINCCFFFCNRNNQSLPAQIKLMPNQIWIVRHAKSSWADANMRDHDRPLNERGNHDAPRMADLILNQIQDNLLLFSSTALRAKTTCEIFANTFKTKNPAIRLSEKLYHASEFDILSHINELEECVTDVMIFAHNPGMSYFANRISNALLMEVPTCGIIKCNVKQTKKWEEIDFDQIEIESHYFPKSEIY